MVKERLSKLQKWILEECYRRGKEYNWYNGKIHQHVLRRRYLLRYFEPSGSLNHQQNLKAISATLSRSIRNLYRKGLIDVASHVWYPENTKGHVEVALKELEELKDKDDDYIIHEGFLGPFTKSKQRQLVENLKRSIEERILRGGDHVEFIKLTSEGIGKAQEALNVKLPTRETINNKK